VEELGHILTNGAALIFPPAHLLLPQAPPTQLHKLTRLQTHTLQLSQSHQVVLQTLSYQALIQKLVLLVLQLYRILL
jgi:hypothetical protein